MTHLNALKLHLFIGSSSEPVGNITALQGVNVWVQIPPVHATFLFSFFLENNLSFYAGTIALDKCIRLPEQ